MKITFLGTGTSSGVPVLTCKCAVCSSLDFRDKRLRVSILLQEGNKNIIFDTGPDFRQQALRESISHLDAVIFTHEHKDHTGGLDDIRPYNYLSGLKNLPIYAHNRVLNQLKQEYYYAFQENPYPGVPIIECNEVVNEPFDVVGVKVQPIDVLHHKLQVFGYRIGDFTYITDANKISDTELAKAKGSKVFVLNALQDSPHISHFSLQEAIEIAKHVGAPETYFTHISHKLGLHREIDEKLPEGIKLAYDGLKIEV